METRLNGSKVIYQIGHSNPSDALTRDQLQPDFNSLAEWCDNNLLSINIKKTKITKVMHKQK